LVELTKALLALVNDKTPRLDGYMFEFCISMWEFFGLYLPNVYKEVVQNKYLGDLINIDLI
jgi:hypothetical protein